MKIKTTQWHVYILVNKKINAPIYVGVSTNVIRRLYKHWADKSFDSYLILESFDNKKEAYAAERGIIKYLSIFQNENICNGLYMPFCNVRNFKPKSK